MTESIHTRPEEYRHDIIELISSPLTNVSIRVYGDVVVVMTNDYEYFAFIPKCKEMRYYPKGEKGLKRYYWEYTETNPMDKEIMEIITQYILLHEMK